VMTLLLRHDEFVDVLMEHPVRMLAEGAADGTPDAEDCHACAAVWDNLFVSWLNQALERACRDDLSQDHCNCQKLGSAKPERRSSLATLQPCQWKHSICVTPKEMVM